MPPKGDSPVNVNAAALIQTEKLAGQVTVGSGFTVIVIAFDVAVVGLAHGLFEVITQVITSPFASDAFA